ncbi:MAG: MBL fold metallo-hydrolase [Syntrophaceticus sp.]|jgi:glyoxylase-like metal-dependent hydrolase (beta-lactamase superfamily II)
MNLTKITGNTYYIEYSTNVGVCSLADNNCLLIDTCFNKNCAKIIDQTLKTNKLHLKYIINTHAHLDHCRGNIYFQRAYPDCQVFASQGEKPFMENPYLLGAIFSSASPLKHLDRSPSCFPVDHYLEAGVQIIDEEPFQVIPLPGHTKGQIGIITPDRVCFLGDAIFSNYTLDTYSLPYNFDIGESIQTLHSLPEIDADYFVISHDSSVITRDNLPGLVQRNLANIKKFKAQILELLKQPQTREDLLAKITLSNNIALNLMGYHVIQTTISAFLTYLNDQKLIGYMIEGGRLYYQSV